MPNTCTQKKSARDVRRAGASSLARERVKLTGYQYCGQAVAPAERGECRLSIQAASKALVIGQQQADANLVAAGKRDLAIACSYAGDLAHARQYAQEAIDSIATGTTRAIVGPALKTLGDVAVREGRLADPSVLTGRPPR